MEFRICFSIAKYENDIFSLCDTSNEFTLAFFPFQNPFSSVRTVKIDHIFAFFLLCLSPVWNGLPYDEIEDRICKE